jgi:hypothetical protein
MDRLLNLEERGDLQMRLRSFLFGAEDRTTACKPIL